MASRIAFDQDCNLAATFGNNGQLHTTFWQKCSDQLEIGTELEANLRAKEISASVGFQVDLQKANLLVRGSVDTNMVVKAVVEKKLMPLPFTLALCGLLNHKKAISIWMWTYYWLKETVVCINKKKDSLKQKKTLLCHSCSNITRKETELKTR